MPISRTWPQVYPGKNHLDPDNWNKVGSYVPRRDWQLVNSVIGQAGGISHIIDHAIKHTADVIRANNLSYLDRDEFVAYLCQRQYTPFRAPVVEQPAVVPVTPVAPVPDVPVNPPNEGKSKLSTRRKRLVDSQRKRTET